VTASTSADDATALGLQVGEAVLRVARDVERALARAAEPEGLTPLAARVLQAIGGAASQRQLGRRLGIGPAQVSVLTSELVERKLVERKADATDHRLRRPVLTAKGRAAANRINARMAGASPVVRTLDDRQLRSLLRTLQRVEGAGR
jgi:DNA-binding MarR family transcriptional regulator